MIFVQPCKAGTKRKSESTINKDKKLKMVFTTSAKHSKKIIQEYEFCKFHFLSKDVSISNKSVGGTDSQDNVLVHSVTIDFVDINRWH